MMTSKNMKKWPTAAGYKKKSKTAASKFSNIDHPNGAQSMIAVFELKKAKEIMPKSISRIQKRTKQDFDRSSKKKFHL